MDVMWSKLLAEGNVNGVWLVVAFVASNLISFLTARGTSKDNTKTELITKAIERQDDLDNRYKLIMDDLQDEMRKVKEDMSDLQKESLNQQKRNSTLSEKYTNLMRENHSLQTLILQLRKEKDDLSDIVKELSSKNAELIEQVQILTREMRSKES